MNLRGFLAPYALYLALAAIAFAAYSGWQIRDWQCDAMVARGKEKLRKQESKLQERADDAATEYNSARDTQYVNSIERRETVRTIYQDRIVDAGCAMPDNARRLLVDEVNAANTRSADSGRMPRTSAASGDND